MPALSETSVKALQWSGEDKRLLDGNGLYLNLRRKCEYPMARTLEQCQAGLRNPVVATI